MKAVGLLLRLFSYVFVLSTSLLLLAIAAVATSSHQPLQLPMLPFSADRILPGTCLIALAGIVAFLLAWTRTLKWVYPLWVGATVYSLVSNYFFSPYVFAGWDDLHAALWFVGGAIVAFCGALWTLKPRRGRLYS